MALPSFFNIFRGLGRGRLAVSIGADFPEVLSKLRTWDGHTVPAELQQRLLREHWAGSSVCMSRGAKQTKSAHCGGACYV